VAKKCILILLDGLGDRSYDQFGDRTPLQAARTPTLDRLARHGSNGMYHAGRPGQALPSENAHFLMFGYDMAEFPGRGALEAVGMGIDLAGDDVAILSHVVSVKKSGHRLILVEGKPTVTDDEMVSLTEEISSFESDALKIRFHPAGWIRGVLTIHGRASRFITDSDPFINGRPLVSVVPWETYRHDEAAIRSAQALTAYLTHVYRKLDMHPLNVFRKKNGELPINAMVTQRAGQLQTPLPFTEKYGLKGLTMASGVVYQGLGNYIGMDTKKVRDSDNPGLDMAERLKMALEHLDNYDFIHIHTKTPDEAAHQKNPSVKKAVIESLDQGIAEGIQPFIENPDVLTIITADHSTPSEGPLIHSGESVPLLLHGRGVRTDSVERFDEVSAATGAVGNLRGKELMYAILNLLDRVKLHGIMDTPYDQPYWPGHYQPFTLE